MHATATPLRRSAQFVPPLPPAGHTADVVRLDGARELRVARGETLFFDGDEARHFYAIVSGTVRCCRLTQDGRRQIFRFASAGDVLGLSGEPSFSYSAEAVTDLVVRRYSLAHLDTAMARDESLRRRVLQSLRDELAAVRTQMLLLGRMTASEKVASFLVALSTSGAGAGGWITIPMSRTDIADYLGLTIETVSRKFNELRRLGVIELKGPNAFRIANLDSIGAMADVA